MAKASVNRSNFTAGEFSVLLEGRTDIDRYPASMREMVNCIAAPQGPCLKRSGTYFVAKSYKVTQHSHLIPFVYNEEQVLNLEFSDNHIRFILEDGVQVEDAVLITNIISTVPFQFTAVGHVCVIGDQVGLSGFNFAYNLNGTIATVINVSGDDITLDITYPGAAGPIGQATISRVYTIEAPYDIYNVLNVRAVQSLDVMYLFCEGFRPYKLSRFSPYDWRIAEVEFIDGPFMPENPKQGRLALSGNGNLAVSGTPTASGSTGAFTPDKAFDDILTTYWQSDVDQTGILSYQLPATAVLAGYTIYIAKQNDDTTFASKDYAPSDWTFEGSHDGVAWAILDTQTEFLLYQNGRSVHFTVNNTIGYLHYRINITKCVRNGTIKPRIAQLTFTASTQAAINMSLSGDFSRLNGGAGFLSTDVDRLLRIKAPDGYYRVYKISAVAGPQAITALMQDEPYISAITPATNWQIGYWSDTTGWPICGGFFDDRLFVAGAAGQPDTIVCSRTGAYENFEQRTQLNEVLDDSAIVMRLNSRKLSRVRWLESDERGLIVGTGSGEWVITAQNIDAALTARNVKARNSTERGSAAIDPVKVDREVLFIKGSKRAVHAITYVLQSDGYKAPSMSLFASHIGARRFEQMVYAADPYSIVWFRCWDGTLAGLTYNREENVIGWHVHDVDGIIESISVLPSDTYKQDILWMVVRREINGQPARYIEKLMPFWDFGNTIDDAHFVDIGLKYEGLPILNVAGLSHLEGEDVYGVADGKPFGPERVVNGVIEMRYGPASKIVVGKRYVAEGEISRPEAGAADGTSQGKSKRIHQAVFFLWESYGGELKRYDEDRAEFAYAPLDYSETGYTIDETIVLKTDMFPQILLEGQGRRGSFGFRHHDPTPFNVISMIYHVVTQDAQ